MILFLSSHHLPSGLFHWDQFNWKIKSDIKDQHMEIWGFSDMRCNLSVTVESYSLLLLSNTAYFQNVKFKIT